MKQSKALKIGLLLVIIFLFISCGKSQNYESGPISETHANGTVTADTSDDNYRPTGGNTVCEVHPLLSYHSYSDEMVELVGKDEFSSWTEKASVPHLENGCMYSNSGIVSFIRYFNVPKEELERVYLETPTYYSQVLNIDLLYSGDDKLIEEFYRDCDRINETEEKRGQFAMLKLHIRQDHYDEWVELFGSDKITPQTSVYEAVRHFGISREEIENYKEKCSKSNVEEYEYNFDVLFDGSLDSLSPIEQDSALCGISDYMIQ